MRAEVFDPEFTGEWYSDGWEDFVQQDDETVNVAESSVDQVVAKQHWIDALANSALVRLPISARNQKAGRCFARLEEHGFITFRNDGYHLDEELVETLLAGSSHGDFRRKYKERAKGLGSSSYELLQRFVCKSIE